MNERLLLGVDAGGTSTSAWVAVDRDHRPLVIGRGLAGTGNPTSVAQAEALANIEHAIDDAFGNARQPRCRVDSACFALAGIDREPVRRLVDHWIGQREIAARWQIVHDAQPLLAHAAGENAVALISGTGSLAWGRRADGRDGRAGGWGPLLGDEGSGYWIGMQALRALVLAHDQRGEPTCLSESLPSHLTFTKVQQLPLAVATLDRRQISALAPLIATAAASGDAVACQILIAAAEQLVGLVVAVATRLGMPDAIDRLVVTGGVVLNVNLVLEQTLAGLRDLGWRWATLERMAEPVAGAVELARQANAS